MSEIDQATQDKYPECSKIAAHHGALVTLRSFVAWLGETKDYDICVFDNTHKMIESHEQLFAEFFDIDLKKAELERQQMLAEIQEANNEFRKD